MPDLKSELMKLENLKFDDDVSNEPAPITTDKTNVSKLVWDTIKAHPNKTSLEIADLMNDGSMNGIATRLKQMIDRGVLSRTLQNGYWTYTAVGEAYPAFSRAEAMARAQAVRLEKKAKRDKQREYNARYKAKKESTIAVAPEVPATSLSKNPSAEQLVNSMSVGMAKAVYLELKKVFEA